MRYHEIVREDDSAMDPIRDAVIDILTPLAANGIQFVSVQQVMDKLGDTDTGVAVDRSLLMSLLNPDNVKIIKSIEGDRINLNTGTDSPNRSVGQEQKAKEADKIKNDAVDQAKKNIGN